MSQTGREQVSLKARTSKFKSKACESEVTAWSLKTKKLWSLKTVNKVQKLESLLAHLKTREIIYIES